MTEHGAAGGVRVEDGGRPVRRPHHAVPRLPGHADRRIRRCATRTRDTDERLGSLMLMQGKTPVAGAGSEGRRHRRGGQAEGHAHRRHAGRRRRPAITFAADPLARAGALLRHRAEEPRRRRQDQHRHASPRGGGRQPSTTPATRNTNELLLSGQGQLHIEVTVAKLKRRFGVEVMLKPPRIPYRETITAAVEAHGRHKKQTGGHGQFGDCKVRFEPLPRGGGFEFVDDIFGGSIPRQFIPAVEKGLQESRQRGFLAGYPMVDFKVTLVRRLVPRRRLERAVVQDRRPPGVQGRHGAGPADAARAGHERRGLRARATSPAT